MFKVGKGVVWNRIVVIFGKKNMALLVKQFVKNFLRQHPFSAILKLKKKVRWTLSSKGGGGRCPLTFLTGNLNKIKKEPRNRVMENFWRNKENFAQKNNNKKLPLKNPSYWHYFQDLLLFCWVYSACLRMTPSSNM